MSAKVGNLFLNGSDLHPTTVEMAIIQTGLVRLEFSWEYFVDLREALIRAMYAVEKGPVPAFDRCELVQPDFTHIRVSCVNEYSKNWLIEAVRKMSPFQGESLVAVEEENLDDMHWHMFHIYVLHSVMTDINHKNILTAIKKSTPCLKTELWKIDSILQLDEGTLIHLEIDAASVRSIIAMKYAIRLGMGWGHVWDRERERGHHEANRFNNRNRRRRRQF